MIVRWSFGQLSNSAILQMEMTTETLLCRKQQLKTSQELVVLAHGGFLNCSLNPIGIVSTQESSIRFLGLRNLVFL